MQLCPVAFNVARDGELKLLNFYCTGLPDSLSRST